MVSAARNPLDSSHDRFRKLRQGAQFPPLILVRKQVDAYLVVMEGHVPLTVYLMAPDYLPSELEVLPGTSAQITTWGCY